MISLKNELDVEDRTPPHTKMASAVKRCATCLLILIIILVSFIALLAAIALYRPLPEKLFETTKDRITAAIIEPITRIVYYYPAKLCPTASCMLHWTRWSLAVLNWLTSPWFFHDTHLLTEVTEWNGVMVRIYYPPNRTSAESDGAVVYIHGGGFGVGSIEMAEPLTRTLAGEFSMRLLVSIDYRLSPETVFPGGLDDCEKVIEFVIAHGPEKYGVNPRKIIVMGESAGGNLATVIAQRRKRRNAEPQILGQALLYPLLQFSDMQTYSYRSAGKALEGLSFVDPLTVAFYYLWYAGVDANAHPEYAEAATRNGHVSKEAREVCETYMDYSLLPESFRHNFTSNQLLLEPVKDLADYMTPFLNNPDFAPLMQPDLSDLPPALVITCEFDLLRDEGVIYARRLEKAGVPTQWKHYEHGFHGMLNNRLDMAKDGIAVIKTWMMKLLREFE